MSARLRQQSAQASATLREQAERDLDLVRRGDDSAFVDTVRGAIEFGFGHCKYPTRQFWRFLTNPNHPVRLFRTGARIKVLRADVLAAMAARDAQARDERRARRAQAAKQRLVLVNGGR